MRPGARVVTLPARDGHYKAGVAMILGATVCLSLGGLILRNIEAADGWQVLFYRSLAFVATLLALLAVRYRGGIWAAFGEIGKSGLLIALFLGAGSTCYLFALLLTTVANVMFIIGATPVFVAIAAWFVIGERVRPVTWVAMIVALGGIGMMVANDLASGRLLGSLVALGVIVTFGGMIVTLRRSKTVDMLPATCLGGVVGGAAAFFMAGDLVISGHDLVLSLLMGSVQFGAGFTLITLGTRYVPAAEVSLLGLVEPILATLWVWVFVNEVPTTLTLVGAAIVVVAVAGQATAGLLRERTEARAAAGR